MGELQHGTGAFVGFDEFIKEFKEHTLPEVPSSEEQLVAQLLEHAIEQQSGIIGMIPDEEMSNDKQAYSFDFICSVSEDGSELLLMYLACQKLTSTSGKS